MLLCSQEEQNRGKPNWEHLNEDLHVLITVEDAQNRAEIKLKRAVEEVRKLLVPAVSTSAHRDGAGKRREGGTGIWQDQPALSFPTRVEPGQREALRYSRPCQCRGHPPSTGSASERGGEARDRHRVPPAGCGVRQTGLSLLSECRKPFH